MNIITIFFYKFLNKKIYIIQPTILKDGITRVYFFKKVLYNLKQALQVWYQTFLDFFKISDFYKTETNYDLFILIDKTRFIAIYINNLFLYG